MRNQIANPFFSCFAPTWSRRDARGFPLPPQGPDVTHMASRPPAESRGDARGFPLRPQSPDMTHVASPSPRRVQT